MLLRLLQQPWLLRERWVCTSCAPSGGTSRLHIWSTGQLCKQTVHLQVHLRVVPCLVPQSACTGIPLNTHLIEHATPQSQHRGSLPTPRFLPGNTWIHRHSAYRCPKPVAGACITFAEKMRVCTWFLHNSRTQGAAQKVPHRALRRLRGIGIPPEYLGKWGLQPWHRTLRK